MFFEIFITSSTLTSKDNVILLQYLESSYNEVDVVNEEVSVEENTNLEINEEGIEERAEEEEKDNYIKEKTVKEEVKYLDMVPQTGDSSNLVLWGVLLVVALGATIGLGIYLMKKK